MTAASGVLSSDVKDSQRAALRQLLIDRALTQTALAKALTDRAEKEELTRRGRLVQYDSAMISRWLDGSSVMSRQAAWLLDGLFPPPANREGFEDLRDRYVLESDREQAPQSAERDLRPLLESARCGAHVLATSLRRSRLDLSDDERLAWFFLPVVDATEARLLIDEVLGRFDGARIVGAYDLLGQWSLLVKIALAGDADVEEVERTLLTELVANDMAQGTSAAGTLGEYRGYRRVTVGRSAITGADGVSDPEFLVLESDGDYDLHRVQRAFVFIDLAAVPPLRRTIAKRQLEELITTGHRLPCFGIVEAVVRGEDCLILELLMACGHEPGRLNQLNKRIGPELTKFRAPKYVLLVNAYDERGWVAVDDG